MSLSARDRHVLHSIEGGLAESDPDLAAKLVKLSLLMADEDKPATRRRQAVRRQVVGSLARWLPGSRWHRHARRHSTWASALMACWLATACALIVAGAVLSHVPANAPCSALTVACGSHSPAGHAQHGTGLTGEHSAASA